MKYLVVKDLFGFGDRLQTLKMCVKYALDRNLKIHVDWRDSTWSHGSESFYSYFNLLMPSFELSEIPQDSKTYPAYWTNKADEILTETTFNSNPELNLGILDKEYDCDVLVVSGCSYRTVYSDSSFFANVFRLNHPEIFRKVRNRQLTYQLNKKFAIHLRGTDRATKIDKQHRMAGLNIRMVASGLLNGVQFIAVSDDPDFIKLWKTRYRNLPILTDDHIVNATHLTPKEQLTITKNELNIRSLVDFFTLMSCPQLITTANDSRFARESQLLHRYVMQIIS